MTEQELVAIEALANAATPGPWVALDEDCVGIHARSGLAHPKDCPCHGYAIGCTEQNDVSVPIYAPLGEYQKRDHRVGDNAAYIAAMHPETAKALVAEVRRLRAENARLKAPPFNPEAARLSGMPEWEIQRRGLQEGR